MRGVSQMTPKVRDTQESFVLKDMPSAASASSSSSPSADRALASQVDKLAALIAKLEKGDPSFQSIDEETIVNVDADDGFTLVARKFSTDAAKSKGT